MHIFSDSLFKYLEKEDLPKIQDQLNPSDFLNFCQSALEVQMYSNEFQSCDSKFRQIEIDLPSLTTSKELPSISQKNIIQVPRDFLNSMLHFYKDTSTNMPDLIKGLKEKAKLSLKEKEKLIKTKYIGVYQIGNSFISYFEKYPGQKLEKIGEYKTAYDAALAYDNFVLKKEKDGDKRKRDDIFELNFPKRKNSSSSEKIREKKKNVENFQNLIKKENKNGSFENIQKNDNYDIYNKNKDESQKFKKIDNFYPNSVDQKKNISYPNNNYSNYYNKQTNNFTNNNFNKNFVPHQQNNLETNKNPFFNHYNYNPAFNNFQYNNYSNQKNIMNFPGINYTPFFGLNGINQEIQNNLFNPSQTQPIQNKNNTSYPTDEKK